MAEVRPARSGRVFLSYRRQDTEFPAAWLYERLIGRFGREAVFKDLDSIDLGDDFAEAISNAVGSCDVLLAVIGREWATITDASGHRRLDDPNDFVRLEIETALQRNVRVIPILVQGATLPRAEQLPVSLAKLVRRQALELSPSRFEYDTTRLLRILEKAIAQQKARRREAEEQAATQVRYLWRFLQKNRQVLGWLGGGVVVLAGGVWVLVTFFYLPHLDLKPKLIAPRDGSTVSQPFLQPWLFKWDEPSGPNSVREYHIRVSGAKAAYPTIDINTSKNEYVDAQKPCSFITDQNRSGWTWRVRAQFNDGSWGEWSDASNFDVVPFDRNLYCQRCPSVKWVCKSVVNG